MTDYLFAQPSALSGMARVGDLFGLFDEYNDAPSPEIADARAIYEDWRAVGEDLMSAMSSFATEAPAPVAEE
jgi:hypothetical protein